MNPYDVLGLDRDCTDDQVRMAYRLLARQHHPDLNPGSATAVAKTQELNAAYEILGDPGRRRAWDAEAAAAAAASRPSGASGSAGRSRSGRVVQDVALGILDFLRGTVLEVRVLDAGNPGGEAYRLDVPAGTVPGTRRTVPRTHAPGGGVVEVRLKLRPDPQFKARGSDLRCDLRIPARRALEGGAESVRTPTGSRVRIDIPRRIATGTVLRVPGEGLPRAAGGRGDLLVRVLHTPEVRITRARSR